jgi:4-hydroxy-tetrahydrodipicolinate reductase
MSHPIKVVIAGCSGRMGLALLSSVFADSALVLHGALDSPTNTNLGQDSGALLGKTTGVKIVSDVRAAIKGADVLIDFTRPEATMEYLAACQAENVQLVIGTTGFSEDQKSAISKTAEKVGVVFAPNMSAGVTLLLNLVEQAASILKDDFDIEVVEMHHKHKVDAPSGTALRLGEAAAAGIGEDLKDVAVYAREGDTGERKNGKIGFATLRGGDVVGDHTVIFAGTGERVELTHKASSRATFALGALRGAKYLADKPNGLFDMRDVLGLK